MVKKIKLQENKLYESAPNWTVDIDRSNYKKVAEMICKYANKKFGLTYIQMYVLAVIYKYCMEVENDTDVVEIIENTLENINYHTENGKLSDGDYDDVISEYKNNIITEYDTDDIEIEINSVIATGHNTDDDYEDEDDEEDEETYNGYITIPLVAKIDHTVALPYEMTLDEINDFVNDYSIDIEEYRDCGNIEFEVDWDEIGDTSLDYFIEN